MWTITSNKISWVVLSLSNKAFKALAAASYNLGSSVLKVSKSGLIAPSWTNLSIFCSLPVYIFHIIINYYLINYKK